jgi:hypothetical protein
MWAARWLLQVFALGFLVGAVWMLVVLRAM